MPFDNTILSTAMSEPPVFLSVTAHKARTEWELDYVIGKWQFLSSCYSKITFPCILV